MERHRSPLAYLGNTGEEFKPTKPFEFSGDGGGPGVAAAAGLSTLGELYEGFLRNNDSIEDTATGIDKAQTYAKSAMLDALGESLAAEARINYMADAQKTREDYEQKVEKENTKSNILSTVGKVVSAAAPFVFPLSDERTKHTIDELEDALGLLRQLKPVTFYYKDEYSAQPERMHYGFIAQEYQKVMPDATYKDESIDKLCIDPIELIGVLVRAVQQLETKVTRLEVKQVMSGVK